MGEILAYNECNNNCIMCNNMKEFTSRCSVDRDTIIGKLRELGKKESVDFIGFTGGEPTMNKDLFWMLKYARKLYPHAEMGLLSNGRMFSYEKYARDFSKLGVNNLKVAIPIHADTAAMHDSITNVKGSYEQTLKGIRNLEKNGIGIEIRVVINRINFRRLHLIADFIARNFSRLLYVVFIVMDMEGNALENKDRIFVDYTEFVPFLEKGLHTLEKGGINTRLYHFPLCTIEPEYWHFVWKSLEEDEVMFLPECEICLYKKYCQGILKSYINAAGSGPFNPVKTKFRVDENENEYKPIKKVSKIQ